MLLLLFVIVVITTVTTFVHLFVLEAERRGVMFMVAFAACDKCFVDC